MRRRKFRQDYFRLAKAAALESTEKPLFIEEIARIGVRNVRV